MNGKSAEKQRAQHDRPPGLIGDQRSSAELQRTNCETEPGCRRTRPHKPFDVGPRVQKCGPPGAMVECWMHRFRARWVSPHLWASARKCWHGRPELRLLQQRYQDRWQSGEKARGAVAAVHMRDATRAPRS